MRWLEGSLGLRASSPLPSGSRLPPSPKGDGFWLLHMLYWVAQKGRLFLGLLLRSRWGGGGLWLFFLPYIYGHTKKSHLVRGGIFDIGFQYLHTVIHLGNCSGNYLVNATPTYWPAPFWRPVTLKPSASPTKRTGT